MGHPQYIQGSWQLTNFTFFDNVDDPIDGSGSQSNNYLRSKNGGVWYN